MAVNNGNIDVLIRNTANDVNVLQPDFDAEDEYVSTFDDVEGNEYGDFRVITTVHSSNTKGTRVSKFLSYKEAKILCDLGLRAGLFVVDGVTYNVVVLGSSKDDKFNRKWVKSVSI